MKIKTINLYEYSELDPKAQQKALADFNENFDSTELTVHLDNLIDDLLKEHDIKPLRDLKGYDSKYAKMFYSLNNSQGDGLMFEGVFDFKGNVVRVEQSGKYYHSHSKTVTWPDFTGEDKDPTEEVIANEFETAYQSICKTLEKAGYEKIEDMQSENAFIETCNANEYLFRKDGTLEHESDPE